MTLGVLIMKASNQMISPNVSTWPMITNKVTEIKKRIAVEKESSDLSKTVT